MSLVVLKVRLMTFLIFSSELDSKLKELVYLYSHLKIERADECLDFYLKSLSMLFSFLIFKFAFWFFRFALCFLPKFL